MFFYPVFFLLKSVLRRLQLVHLFSNFPNVYSEAGAGDEGVEVMGELVLLLTGEFELESGSLDEPNRGPMGERSSPDPRVIGAQEE